MAQCLTRGTASSFVRALCVSFSYVINKNIGRFLAFQILRSLFFFHYILQNNYFTHTHIYRSTSTLDLTGNDYAIAGYDFKNPINLAKDEGEYDCKVPGELARLLLQEERVIQPYEEPVDRKSVV